MRGDDRTTNCPSFDRFFQAKAPTPPTPFARNARSSSDDFRRILPSERLLAPPVRIRTSTSGRETTCRAVSPERRRRIGSSSAAIRSRVSKPPCVTDQDRRTESVGCGGIQPQRKRWGRTHPSANGAHHSRRIVAPHRVQIAIAGHHRRIGKAGRHPLEDARMGGCARTSSACRNPSTSPVAARADSFYQSVVNALIRLAVPVRFRRSRPAALGTN